MNLAITTTTIPNSFLDNLPLFEPRELPILLVLFYHSPLKFTDIISGTGLTEQECKKYSGQLIKHGVVNVSDQGEYFLNVRVDTDSLKKRGAPRITQTKIDLGDSVETDGAKIQVTKWEDFMLTSKMSDVQRKMIYLFFKATGFDVNHPDQYIDNVTDWRTSAWELYRIVGNDTWLIAESVKKLKEGKMTVTTLRSIFKTVRSLKVAGAAGVNDVKKDTTTVTDLW